MLKHCLLPEEPFVVILNDSGLFIAILRTFSADALFQMQRYITKPAFAFKTANFCYVFTLFNILPVGLAHARASPNASNRREQPTPKSSLKGRGHEGAMPLHL